MELDERKTGTLLRVWDALRAESLAHRASIREACGWWVAGMLVLGAGVLSLDKRSSLSASLVSLVVVVAIFFFMQHVRYQRKGSHEAMRQMIEIEETLGFYDKGEYLPENTALPADWKNRPNMDGDLTRGDEFAIGLPLALSGAVILLTWMLTLNSNWVMLGGIVGLVTFGFVWYWTNHRNRRGQSGTAEASDATIRARIMMYYAVSPTLAGFALATDALLMTFLMWGCGVLFFVFALFLRAGCKWPKWLRRNLAEPGEAWDYFVLFVALLGVVLAIAPINAIVAAVLFCVVIIVAWVFTSMGASSRRPLKPTASQSTPKT